MYRDDALLHPSSDLHRVCMRAANVDMHFQGPSTRHAHLSAFFVGNLSLWETYYSITDRFHVCALLDRTHLAKADYT